MMMLKNSFKIGMIALLSATSFSAWAEDYVVVAPQCLIKNLTTNYQSLASAQQLALIKTNDAGLEELMLAKGNQKQLCGGFINVTDKWKNTYTQQTKQVDAKNAAVFLSQYTKPKSAALKNANTTYNMQYPNEVNQALAQLNPQEIWSNLTTLTNFPDRHANSDTGVQAAEWMKTQVETMAKTYGRNDVHVYFINTGSAYKQPSVIAKIGTSNEPGIVVSGHLDTMKARSSNMPGADDDGSGSVTVLEATRTVLASHMQFKRPIYMIWYAAEEEGLVGSQHVVADFQKQNIPVANVLHFDMTGYTPKNDPTMWVMDDYTSKDLTTFLANLITTYVKVPVKHTACGYGCSDHATWTENGYNATIATEAKFGDYDPYLHTPQDTMAILSLNHMANFAKLATAFAIELAEPVSKK
jgi:leucyl aminopeptidase